MNQIIHLIRNKGKLFLYVIAKIYIFIQKCIFFSIGNSILGIKKYHFLAILMSTENMCLKIIELN